MVGLAAGVRDVVYDGEKNTAASLVAQKWEHLTHPRSHSV